MSKNRKKKRDNSKTTRELSLILPAFSFMWDRLEKVSKGDSNEPDVKMARNVATRMAYIIRRFSIPAQKKALDFSNKCMHKASFAMKENHEISDEHIDENGGVKINVFSLGLGLLGMHHEHKNKTIHIGMLNDLIELQDYCDKNIEKDEINRAYKYCDYVYKYAMQMEI